MENSEDVKSHQEKKDDLMKLLFKKEGILNFVLHSLPNESRESFFYKFIKTEGVQSAISKFIGDVRKQCVDDVNLFNESLVNTMDNHEIGNNLQKSKLITPSGSTMVEKSSIVSVNFQSHSVGNASQTSSLPVAIPQNQTISTVSQSEKQAMTIMPSQIQPVLAATSSLTQVNPGGIPPVNTPTPKPPTPNLEQTRTTFSVTANGKANVEFIGKVEGKSANGKPVIIIDVTIPPELGLSFNTVTSELTGVPLLAGEFKLTVHFQFENHVPGNPTPDGECNLIINPDPKTLWKDLPSVETEVYWKKDSDLSALAGKDGLDIIAASKRGRSHAHIGSCRDDDFCLMQDEASGWRVITVADGAGSAKMSRKGSLIASRTATDSVLKALVSERGRKLDEAILIRESDPTSAQKLIRDELYYIFGNAATEAVQAINVEAQASGAAYKDFSTTLIVTIHKKVAAGHFVAAYWVGDGGVGIYRQGKEVKILGKADSGEFAGQTRFLDSAMLVPQEIVNRIDAKIVDNFTSIIAMTDGITDPWFETDANLESILKWDELWTDLAPAIAKNTPAEGLLEWLNFWSPGNHDDRTIAVLYYSEPNVRVTTEAVV